jgi:hypothetical protein
MSSDQAALNELRIGLVEAFEEIAERPESAPAAAARMLAKADGQLRQLLAGEVEAMARQIVASVIGHGWSPTDLAEILRRRSVSGLGTLSTLLDGHTRRFPTDRVAPAWWRELAELPARRPLGPLDPAGLAELLAVAGLLSVLPKINEVIPPPGRYSPQHSSREGRADPDGKQLARVRALLAKAESTNFDAEAEALTAKAQELITRYALERLLDRVDEPCPAAPVGTRRIWIDAPYVMAKATLLNVVSEANRCRAVLSESLGFITVIGEPGDLDAVELLATSLLVQANSAMLRHGSQVDRGGTSRTRSFRQSFLLAYATRIGERLRAADTAAAEATGLRERLLPVLAATDDAVRAHTEQMFPELRHARAPQASHGHGWAAGRAAADLALLDLTAQVAATA